MADPKQAVNALKKIMQKCFKEIGPPVTPIKAKVVKVHAGAGIYSCDVQPLNFDGSVDEDFPIIPDVPIDVLWNGSKIGVYCLPTVGCLVRIEFYYWDLSQPYVAGIIQAEKDIPNHNSGELAIIKDGVRLVVSSSGIKIRGNVEVSGSINASGSVIDGGGNTNHHSH